MGDRVTCFAVNDVSPHQACQPRGRFVLPDVVAGGDGDEDLGIIDKPSEVGIAAFSMPKSYYSYFLLGLISLAFSGLDL